MLISPPRPRNKTVRLDPRRAVLGSFSIYKLEYPCQWSGTGTTDSYWTFDMFQGESQPAFADTEITLCIDLTAVTAPTAGDKNTVWSWGLGIRKAGTANTEPSMAWSQVIAVGALLVDVPTRIVLTTLEPTSVNLWEPGDHPFTRLRREGGDANDTLDVVCIGDPYIEYTLRDRS